PNARGRRRRRLALLGCAAAGAATQFGAPAVSAQDAGFAVTSERTCDVVIRYRTRCSFHRSSPQMNWADWCLEPLQQVEVIAVWVLEADHARPPRLILGRTTEHDTGLAQLAVERVDIADDEADMVDARRVAEQAEL